MSHLFVTWKENPNILLYLLSYVLLLNPVTDRVSFISYIQPIIVIVTMMTI